MANVKLHSGYDLFDISESMGIQIIMHGCNRQGVMGAGFAKQIKDKYPILFQKYHDKCLYENIKLGDVIIERTPDFLIINAITQDDYGTHKRQIHYGALASACMKVNKIFENEDFITHFCQNGKTLSMPKIGCGLAGGDWDVIKEILEGVLNDDIIVHVFEK